MCQRAAYGCRPTDFRAGSEVDRCILNDRSLPRPVLSQTSPVPPAARPTQLRPSPRRAAAARPPAQTTVRPTVGWLLALPHHCQKPGRCTVCCSEHPAKLWQAGASQPRPLLQPVPWTVRPPVPVPPGARTAPILARASLSPGPEARTGWPTGRGGPGKPGRAGAGRTGWPPGQGAGGR
jgi:hypothetical protein